MANWQEVIAPYAHDIEEHFDRLKYALKYRLGGPGPIKIVPYRGFGNRERVYLKGRVLEDRGITPPSDNDSLWRNIVNTWKRLNTKEVPFARLRLKFYGKEFEIQADEEGMIAIDFSPADPLPTDTLWHDIDLRLLSPLSDKQEGPVRATGKILVPSPQAEFGVISDIDDTILVTNAGNILKVARVLFVKNARTRLPFPGAAAFYRSLSAGTGPGEYNPIYYVSSSPWNLYDLLIEFLRFQGFPPGPILFLRKWGISDTEILPIHHKQYKVGAISRIMDMNPELPFFLIGDSGQEDPEIYTEIIRRYPGRIRSVYIRNVSKDLKRADEIHELAKKAIQEGSSLVLADNTLVMAEHAVENGWIRRESLSEIGREKEEDEGPPSVMEKLLGEDEKPEAPKVKIEGGDKRETERAVESGAIESALEEGGGKKKKPPEVVVEPEKKPEQKDEK